MVVKVKEYYRNEGLKELAEKNINIAKIKNQLNSLQIELDELTSDENVKKFIKAKEIEEQLTSQRKIGLEAMKKQIQGLYLRCNHEIWYYQGCTNTTMEKIYLPSYQNRCVTEHKYICLECGYEIKRRDALAFEMENRVLKNQGEIAKEKGYEYYSNLYFELLCTYPAPLAIEKIQALFYQNTNGQKRILKKAKENYYDSE